MHKHVLTVALLSLLFAPVAFGQVEHIRVHGMIIPLDEELGMFPAFADSESVTSKDLQRWGLEQVEADRLWTTLNQDRKSGKWTLGEVRLGDQIWVKKGDSERVPVYLAECINRQIAFASGPTTREQLQSVLGQLGSIDTFLQELPQRVREDFGEELKQELDRRISVDRCAMYGECGSGWGAVLKWLGVSVMILLGTVGGGFLYSRFRVRRRRAGPIVP